MKKYQNFLSENFHFLVGKFSVYLNRHVFLMILHLLLNQEEQLPVTDESICIKYWLTTLRAKSAEERVYVN